MYGVFYVPGLNVICFTFLQSLMGRLWAQQQGNCDMLDGYLFIQKKGEGMEDRQGRDIC